MSSLPTPVEPLFAAEGGVTERPSVATDPYLALDDLMAVVEIFCPVWPQRDIRATTGKMLL